MLISEYEVWERFCRASNAAKLAARLIKLHVLQKQLETSEKSDLDREAAALSELRNEVAVLKNSLTTMEERNSALELELANVKKDSSDTVEKLKEAQLIMCSELQKNMRSLEEKLSNLMDENHENAISLTRRESYKILSHCIKENLGFQEGLPVAACVIYRCLLHWHAFESESASIFDFIIEEINEVLKVGDEDETLPYWLSNASALLCLLQNNATSHRFPSFSEAVKSPFKNTGFDPNLFKKQLAACVEMIFGLIRDKLKKELSPLLNQCIKAPENHGGKPSRSPGVAEQSSNQWDSIIKFLDSLMSRLNANHVPSFFIRKLITRVFSFINISLFNSLLLRQDCCTFSNGEYFKSGLAELQKWIVTAKEEFARTSWHELKYIRQAVGFLVVHQKRKKSLDEIRNDLCPALHIRQIYQISTMYWDDKYGTQSVSNEVVSQMREILSKDSQKVIPNSFLLDDDDLSIPFSTDDICTALPFLNPVAVDLPKFLLLA